MSELLHNKTCKPCEGGVPPLTAIQINELHSQTPKWRVSDDNKQLTRVFEFKNFYHTMAFVNAIAWVANHENHHPDMQVGYNSLRVTYTTHAIGGLSENDFICAARIDALAT